ncbi:MAG: hypothetical protein AAGA12_14645 [Pseudomonadota bacterium]
MTATANCAAPHWDCKQPHVLVVDRNVEFGKSIVAALEALSICAKHTRTVDEYLDFNCPARVDLVSLEIDAMDPETLDNLRLLRTHFGEGPGTRIVATSVFAPGAFPFLVEQRGADTCISKDHEPDTMAATLETELQHLKNRQNAELCPASCATK